MIKEVIKQIPVLGPLARTLYRKATGQKRFTNSKDYWEDRYSSNGNSGAGSYNQLAEFKAEVINQFVLENEVDSVIEFGSGDGNQLRYFEFPSYTGIDVSPTAVANCRKMYRGDRTKRFETLDNYQNETADLAMSLDVIFHLVEDEVYTDYMQRLFAASNKYVIVYSSNDDNHENNDVVAHVRHRKFTDWVEQHAPDFEMTRHIPNRYPFNGDNDVSSYADFYLFRSKVAMTTPKPQPQSRVNMVERTDAA